MTASVIDLQAVRALRRLEAVRKAIATGHPCVGRLRPQPSDNPKEPTAS